MNILQQYIRSKEEFIQVHKNAILETRKGRMGAFSELAIELSEGFIKEMEEMLSIIRAIESKLFSDEEIQMVLSSAQTSSTTSKDVEKEDEPVEKIVTIPKIATSYFIDRKGKLHQVEDSSHDAYAKRYLEAHHTDILKMFAISKGKHSISSLSQWDMKDLIVGELGWVTFTPLGNNTHVADTGVTKENRRCNIKFTKKQIERLIELWALNHNRPESLEKLLEKNMFRSMKSKT